MHRVLGPLCAVAVSLSASMPAQNAPVLSPPEGATIEGVPPIPASLGEALIPYADYRTAHLVAWHPARREMLICTRFGSAYQLHHVKQPGGARTQLTFVDAGIARTSGVDAIGWFEPGTGHIVYLRDVASGKRLDQYFHYDPSTARTTLLTDGRSRSLPGAWSRKQDRLAYTSNRRNGQDFDLYIIAPDEPTSDRLVAELKGSWLALDWSPDGAAILARQFQSAVDSRLWLIDVATGRTTQVSPDDGTPSAYSSSARFSADGRRIYAVTNRDSEFFRAAWLELASRRLAPISPELDGDVNELALSPDGRLLAYVANEQGVGTLHIHDLVAGRERPRPKIAGDVAGVRWHPATGELGFHVTSGGQPSNTYSLDPQTGDVIRWTESEAGGIAPGRLRDAQLIRWKSFDGRSISGLIYHPPAPFTGRRPVIINIHGGPEDQARPIFWGRSNYLLNEHGIAIIQPNVRGSGGFGTTFLNLDNGRNREGAVKDIGALLDWIAAQPDLDPSRVHVVGASYGGYMALATAIHYGDRIRSAAANFGISNFVSFLERVGGERLRRAEYGDERDPEMRKFLEGISPLTSAEKIRVPLYIAHGKNDPQVPVQESERIAEAVRKNGVPVWYIAFADEGHGFGRRANIDFSIIAWVQFVRESLLK